MCDCDLLVLQEAFKTIEDIHSLLNYSKKPPKPAVVANYYNKQSKVYLMAGDRLYHACACHQLFVLSREQKKNLSQEELQKYVYGANHRKLLLSRFF